MEENTFASFTPITSFGNQDAETLKRYYMENNLSPDNALLKKYLNWSDDIVIPTSATASAIPATAKTDISKLLGNLTYTAPASVEQVSTNTNTPVSAGPAPKSKKEFLEKYEASAIQAAEESGISKDLLLAQVALETGWGKHTPSNNIGGIKANKSWKGKRQDLLTKEFENGQYVRKPQTFRAYDTPDEGFKDYVDFLMSNSRYHILKGISDPYKAAITMGRTGYATDPKYTSKLQTIIKQIQTT